MGGVFVFFWFVKKTAYTACILRKMEKSEKTQEKPAVIKLFCSLIWRGATQRKQRHGRDYATGRDWGLSVVFCIFSAVVVAVAVVAVAAAAAAVAVAVGVVVVCLQRFDESI